MARRIGMILLVLGALGTACGQSGIDSQPARDLEHIRVPMGYIANVQYAPFYVAVEKGYFSDAGFEIEFDYSFETDGLALVGAEELPFAVVSGEQVLLARAQQVPVVYVAAWFQDFPVAVVSKAGSGIITPQDLTGRQIGLPGLFGANYIGLRALLSAGDIREDQVTLDSIGFNQVEALATDQEEVVVGYVSNEPVQLQAQGYPVEVLRVSDYVHLVANGIISNETTIKNDPEMVRRFVGAFLRGLADALEDPDEAYEISKNYVEGLASADENVEKEVLALSLDYWQADRLGYSDREGWENMAALLLEMGLLSEMPDLDEAFTNQFIE